MPFAAAAVGLAAVGGVADAVIGANASRSAASSIAKADQAATDLERQQFQQTEANLDPFLQAGTKALPTLQGLLGTGGQAPNPTAFTSSPGYQFMMGQGTQAVNNSASATGGRDSGNTLKALTQYGQGLANSTYQQYLGNISGMVGMGQNAANQIGGFGQNFANQAGQNTIAAGTARGAGTLGAAQSMIGGINGVLQAMGSSNGMGGGGNSGYSGNSGNSGNNSLNNNNNAGNINLGQLFAQMLASSGGGGNAPYGSSFGSFG